MKSLYKALDSAQKDFPIIRKTADNPFFKSKYADLSSILEVVVPVLRKHGLTFTQSPVSDGESIGVSTSIIHVETGEALTSSFTMPIAQKNPQGSGSAITYARRYALVTILGLNVDEDDDGNLASYNKAEGTAPVVKRR